MSAVRLLTATSLKAADESGKRILRGIASTVHEDLHGDVVVPKGLTWASLPLPLLWGHSHQEVIGKVTEIRATETEVRIVAEFARGIGKADEVWTMVTLGYATGLSVGFVGKRHEPHGKRGLRWIEAELIEISVVPCPSNRESRILSSTGKAGSGAVKLVSPARHSGGIPLITQDTKR